MLHRLASGDWIDLRFVRGIFYPDLSDLGEAMDREYGVTIRLAEAESQYIECASESDAMAYRDEPAAAVNAISPSFDSR
jgi:hypothetical protein